MSERLRKTGRLHGKEHRWVDLLLLIMEQQHQRAFGERHAYRRIFVVEGKQPFIMRYLPPARAAEDLGRRIPKGQDAFMISLEGLMEYLETKPDVYSWTLGINRGRPIPKHLWIALLALHECRHKAQFQRKVHLVNQRNILTNLNGTIPTTERLALIKFLREWSSLNKLLQSEEHELPRKEADARLLEGVALYLWEYQRIRGMQLLTESFPRLILLAPK